VHRFRAGDSEGPEYETIALCGSNCEIGDLEALGEFNRQCDEFGLDTISSGAVVGLAMDLSECGMADFGLRFGEPGAYILAPCLIATREGVGAELALGCRELALRYGRPALAFEVKNLEMPGYDPRGSFGMALAYATSDRGACHMRGYPVGDEVLAGTMRPDSLSGKAKYIADAQDFVSFTYSGIWCANWAIDLEGINVHMRHLWGRELSADELSEIGARIWNLGRVLNLREGVTAAADTIPTAMFTQAHADGPAAGRTLDPDEFNGALQEYYAVRGWDVAGVPLESTLRRLRVDVVK